MGPPVGYIRTKIHSRSILVKALVDSGNLCADLISDTLANKLKLKIIPTQKEVGTAASSGAIKIIGRIPRVKIFLENIKQAIIIKPYVVKDLSHHINLGQTCLRRNKAKLNFSQDGGVLEIRGEVTKLKNRSVPITTTTADARIQGVLSILKDQGGNPRPDPDADMLDLRIHAMEPEGPTKKRPIHFDNNRVNLYNKQKVKIKAQCSSIITLTSPGKNHHSGDDNDVFLIPKTNCQFTNKNQLLVHPGCYRRKGQDTEVLITNFSGKDVTLPAQCNVGHKLEAEAVTHVNELSRVKLTEMSESETNQWRKFIIEELRLDENDQLNQHPKIKEEIVDIFMQNRDAIAINDYDYGNTQLMKFTIDIPPGTKPVRAKVRPLNPFQEQDLKRQIDEWKEAGVIEPSIAPWASALVPCKKKGTDKLRWAIDFRKVNELTVKDAYPLPSINTNLDKLSGSAVFTTLDSAGAFHTLTVDERSRDYTTFVSPHGSYRFVQLPFGLANAPASYSRLVQMALDRLDPGFALGYIDDIICHSKTLQEHVSHLRQLVELHSSCGMKLKLKKCQIAQNEVEYLGHLVNAKGIRMIPSYVSKVLEWPLPKTGKELQSFLGFSGYYRAFITEYSHLTFEMNKMKTNKGELTWSDEAIQKFEKLKKCFQTAPLRGYPDYHSSEPFILDTDWSATNSAGVLSQIQNGKEVFLGCTAKKNDKCQANYPSFKGELLAFVLSCKKFEHILRAKPFILRTDSRCIQFLKSVKESRGIYARWQNFLAGFQYTVRHRKGTRHVNADGLSRLRGIKDEADQGELDLDDGMADVDDIYHLVGAINEIPIEQPQQATKNDGVISQVLKYVKKKQKPNKEERKHLGRDGMCYVNLFECLLEENGLLYFQPPTVDGKITPRRLCLPTTMQKEAFNVCHQIPEAGHMGARNTYLRMKKRFYFPHLYAYISTHITNCIPCITKKSNKNKPQHQMHHETLSYFGQRIYADTVGPLTGAEFQGKVCRHFLTIQDGFTRYLVCVPISDLTTETVAEAIVQNWIHTFGCPETLHTDRGTSFTSRLFQEVMKRFNITKTVTPAYSPEGNRVERVHQTLGNIMRSDRQFDCKEWPNKLKIACFVYNTSVHRIIGLSPFEAVFGHEATLPVDMIFPLKRKEGRSWSNYVEHLRLTYQRLYKRMCEHEMTTIALDSPHYQGRSADEFKEDDLVYYFLGRISRGISKKLQSRWIGPFKIVRKVSESLVVIKPEGSWSSNPKEISTIVSRLRKVDKDLYYSELHPSRRYQVDLPAILDDVEDLDGVIGFQPDFENDDESPIPDTNRPQMPAGCPQDYSEPLGGPIIMPAETPIQDAEVPLQATAETAETIPKLEPPDNQANENEIPEHRESDINQSEKTLISDSDRANIPVTNSQGSIPRYPIRTNRYEGSYAETGSYMPRGLSRKRGKPRVPRGILYRK